MEETQVHPMSIIIEYMDFIKPGSLENHPGIWESKINDDFTLKLNPTNHELEEIPPYHFYITYKRWPFGLFFAGDGTGEIMHIGSADEGYSIELFQKAVKERINS